jgi:hypothetical protein
MEGMKRNVVIMHFFNIVFVPARGRKWREAGEYCIMRSFAKYY